MATSSVGDTPFGAGYTPTTGFVRMGASPIPTRAIIEETLTTAGGARTLTAAEAVSGLLAVLNVDDAQTVTLPTAALLNAAIPGACVGATVAIDFVNIGDSQLTIAVGTGGTLVAGNSKSTVATVAAAASKRILIRVTGVKKITGADSYTVYSFGSVAASVA